MAFLIVSGVCDSKCVYVKEWNCLKNVLVENWKLVSVCSSNLICRSRKLIWKGDVVNSIGKLLG